MKESHFEHFNVRLSSIIRWYIEENLKKKDWEPIAVDTDKDIVVFQRFESAPKPSTKGEGKK